MNKRITLLLIASFSLLFISASYGQSATSHTNKAKRSYEKSNYADACFESMKALKIKPKKTKAQEILALSYELAQETLLEDIEDLKSSSLIYKSDVTVTQRTKIVKLYKTLKKLDKNLYEISKIVKSKKYDLNFERIDVTSEYNEAVGMLSDAKEYAAEEHYSKGLMLMKNGDLESSKNAAKEFKIAKNYIPNYKQSSELYEEARKNGTTRLAIFAFDNKSGTMNFGEIGESVSDQLSSSLFNNKEAMEFVEIVSRDELGKLVAEHNLNMSADINQNTVADYGELMGVHVIITGKITQASSEHQRVIHDAPYTVSQNAVVGTETYVNSKGKTKSRSVYGDVYAQIIEHRKSSKAILSGSFKVIDVKTGRILSQDQFNEMYDWLNKWITFTGNQSAINRSKYNSFDTNELNPPTNFEMGNHLVSQLTKKMAVTITNLLK